MAPAKNTDVLLKYVVGLLVAGLLSGAAWVANNIYYMSMKLPVIEVVVKTNNEIVIDNNKRLTTIEGIVNKLPTKYPPEEWQERIKHVETTNDTIIDRLIMLEAEKRFKERK